jgi:hypothetical protein
MILVYFLNSTLENSLKMAVFIKQAANIAIFFNIQNCLP